MCQVSIRFYRRQSSSSSVEVIQTFARSCRVALLHLWSEIHCEVLKSNYRVRHLTLFFQLVRIWWMVTPISCLIWQIISFIRPPNEYGWVYAWTTLGSGPAIDLQKMPILAKKKSFFSNEAHFDPGGYINKHNCPIWGKGTPHAYIEIPTHPKQVTVWCGFWSSCIIGPFFFENEQGEAVIINCDRYRPMLNKFLFTKIDEEDVGNIWFQQEGATCYTADATLDGLPPVFKDFIISRRADVVWPSQSCDLTPLDYYLWRGVKDKYYTDKPETIDALKYNMREAIGEIHW